MRAVARRRERFHGAFLLSGQGLLLSSGKAAASANYFEATAIRLKLIIAAAATKAAATRNA
jgi:hypothetical protein